MANHLSYNELIRLLERQGAPDEEARAERHLARCGRCRDERQWLERIRNYPQVRRELNESA